MHGVPVAECGVILVTAVTRTAILLIMDRWWLDRTAAWWAKAARAKKHVGDIVGLADAYARLAPHEVRREAGGHPGETCYRFRFVKPVPVELLTTIGDAVHNMRSRLDSVAHELARQHVGGQMTSNIGKHRRPPLLAWYLDFAYFTEDVGDIKFQARLPSAPLDDNSVIASISDPRDSTAPGPQPRFEFNLSLADDTAAPHGLSPPLAAGSPI
jgi:hypothetical protein